MSVCADAHNALGNLLGDSAEYTRARQHYEEALALRREIADSEGIAGALNNLGIVAAWLGDYDGALALYRESLELRRAQHDAFGMALCFANLGDVLLAQGDFDGAQEYQAEALRLRELLHDAAGSAYSVYNLGEIARLRGDTAEAGRHLTDSLCRFEALGDKLGIAYAECSLGDLASRKGDTARAAQLLERALRTRKEIGDKRGVIECLEALAMAAIRSGEDEPASDFSAQPGPSVKRSPARSRHQPGTNTIGRLPERACALAGAVDALHEEGRLFTPEQAHALAYEIVDRLDAGESRAELSQRLAARHADDLAGDVARLVRGQEDEERRQLRRLAGTTQRRVLAELLHLLLRHGGGDERGPDRTGGHDVDPDPLLCPLLGQRLGEGDDRPLGAGVGQQRRRRLVGLDGGGVDDRAPRLQVRPGRLAQVVHGKDVRPEGVSHSPSGICSIPSRVIW